MCLKPPIGGFRNLASSNFDCGMVMIAKGGALWAFFDKLVPIDMAVYSDHADSFELDHFDQKFYLIFLAKSETIQSSKPVL